MAEVTSEKHYESKYVSSLLTLIRERAEERDISLSDASYEVFSEFDSKLSFGDSEAEDEIIAKRMQEMAAVRVRMTKENLFGGKK